MQDFNPGILSGGDYLGGLGAEDGIILKSASKKYGVRYRLDSARLPYDIVQ
jgi:hypothetical protein